MDDSGKHWKTLWEEYSETEKRTFDAKPVEELLNYVEVGHYGAYYRIWYSIAERATLSQAGISLLKILHLDIEYLFRYHCASALLDLMDETVIKPVDLSADHADQGDFLKRIEKKLETMLIDSPGTDE